MSATGAVSVLPCEYRPSIRPAAPVSTISGIRTLSARLARPRGFEYLTTALGLPKSQAVGADDFGAGSTRGDAHNTGRRRNARKLNERSAQGRPTCVFRPKAAMP